MCAMRARPMLGERWMLYCCSRQMLGEFIADQWLQEPDPFIAMRRLVASGADCVLRREHQVCSITLKARRK